MEITKESADWIKFLLHRIATAGCTGIKCRKCILKFRCVSRRPSDSRTVAINTIKEITQRNRQEAGK